jgi:hypothetical protein
MPEPSVRAETMAQTASRPARHVHFLLRLGPGLITGAADDDPSGIATYSQVGALFGMGMLWTMLFSFPLMAAMQEICARLGRITGAGIAENLRKNYPKPVLYGLVLLLCWANIFNLGADVTAMGAAAQLVFGGSLNAYALGFGLLSLFLVVYVPYKKYVHYLKWLTLALFAYVATAFVVHVPWKLALRSTVIPSVSWTADYWMALVAVLGTTISPYLFFWQTSEEAEDVRLNGGRSKRIQNFAGSRWIHGSAWDFRTWWHSSLSLPRRRRCTPRARAKALRPPPMPPRRCNRWRDDLRFCFSRWGSSARACWLCRCWQALPPMLWRRHSDGAPVWKAGRVKHHGFMRCWRQRRSSESL